MTTSFDLALDYVDAAKATLSEEAARYRKRPRLLRVGDRKFVVQQSGGQPNLVGSVWAEIPLADRKAIMLSMGPIPGLLIAKILFGASWPVAAATGIMSAPLTIALVLWALRPKPAA